jgi:succinate dehydrogenase/fumarate reductase iron-sulfur protein
MSETEKNIEFNISRYNPEKKEHYLSTYKVPIRKGTTVLEALLYIKDKLDETLTFRHSCRMGICGSCGMNINEKPMLACYTQVFDLKTNSVEIEPLATLPLIRDLVVDMEPFFKKYDKVKTYLIKPEETLNALVEFIQTPANLQKYWDLSLCTKCGICHSACPAAINEKFLGPSTLTSQYRFIIDSRDQGKDQRLKPMLDNIWLCTQCNSCTIFCPKDLNCANAILDDRSLVVETGEVPKTVIDVLDSVYNYHNPLRTHQNKRMEWTEDHIKTYPNVLNSDILFFVCCSNAFDARNQESARIMTHIFDKLKVNYATLGTEEWCCGDHILRLGEKGLFEELATHNIEKFKQMNEKTIITLSPHCYNTFKNDKPYSEAKLNVQHYTQFLSKAIKDGKIKLTKSVQKRKVAYHDPCFLGKRNNVYDPPREILRSIEGLEFIEMRRKLQNSYCCGGGAGRVWTEDTEAEKRSGVSRVKEALELGVDTIAVACPFCITMLEDAIKVLDVENKIVVKDILELIKEAI